MNGDEFINLLNQQSTEINTFLDDIFPHLAGDMAANHFKENFEKEGFVDNGLTPWEEVKRRDPESPWYGFSPYATKRFSPTRATDPILKDTNELQDATDYEKRGSGEVAIINDKPYAAVHNEGGQASVFGKKPFKMPKRQFIGHSKELDIKVEEMLTNEMDEILK